MNDFVWADLSTYDPNRAMRFYNRVFGWDFQDADGYYVAMRDSKEVVGIFETPKFFQEIKMPHFWMSYIRVEDALATAERASRWESAKVELTDNFYGGKVALIRDPQGAGFMVYDGGKLNHRSSKAGFLAWNELHVSEASMVIPFYEELFGWTIRQSHSTEKFCVHGSNGEHVSDVLEIPNELKGQHEYWVCTFAVTNLEQAKNDVAKMGGGVVSYEGQRVMMHDESGEAFFYLQSAG